MKMIKIFTISALLFLQYLTVTSLHAQATLIAWYPFNGNAHDETGNGYNGTVSGATLTADRFGNAMSAYSFDGITSKIVIGKEPNFPLWNTYAVSAWFLNDGGGSQPPGYGQKILSKAQFNSDFHLAVGWGRTDAVEGNLSWWSAQGGFYSVVDPIHDYRDNKWHHVVLNKKSPSTGDLWVDGVLQNSSNELAAVFNNENLVIGFTTHSDGFQQKHWSGKIDDIRIYDSVLSKSEISDLFTEGNHCPPPTGIKVQDISDTSAILKWKVAGPEILHVRVRYRVVGGTTWTIKNKQGDKPSLHINGLTSSTIYQWQTRSFCADDTTGWVNGPDFTTAASLNPGITATAYPNPAKNTVTVNYAATRNGKYIFEITNASGNVVLRKEANAIPGANRITLDISRFFKGVYFINIIKPGMIREKIQLNKE